VIGGCATGGASSTGGVGVVSWENPSRGNKISSTHIRVERIMKSSFDITEKRNGSVPAHELLNFSTLSYP
jgi:hypothetical protein